MNTVAATGERRQGQHTRITVLMDRLGQLSKGRWPTLCPPGWDWGGWALVRAILMGAGSAQLAHVSDDDLEAAIDGMDRIAALLWAASVNTTPQASPVQTDHDAAAQAPPRRHPQSDDERRVHRPRETTEQAAERRRRSRETAARRTAEREAATLARRERERHERERRETAREAAEMAYYHGRREERARLFAVPPVYGPTVEAKFAATVRRAERRRSEPTSLTSCIGEVWQGAPDWTALDDLAAALYPDDLHPPFRYTKIGGSMPLIGPDDCCER